MALAGFWTLIILLWGSLSQAAVVFDAASSVSVPVVADASFTHTASGSERLAILCVGSGSDPPATIITKTYGGLDMTLVGTVGSPVRLAMYSRLGPPIGPQLVSIEWDSSVDRAVIGVATFTGVDQTTPLGTFASNTADDSGPATVSVASAVGDLVIDCVYGNDDTLTIAAVSPQTVTWEQDPGGIVPGGSSTKAGVSPTVTMSWTLSQGTNWRIGGVSMKPSVAAAPQGTVRRRIP